MTSHRREFLTLAAKSAATLAALAVSAGVFAQNSNYPSKIITTPPAIVVHMNASLAMFRPF